MNTDSTKPLESQFRKLLTLVARLRSPSGCPWDRAQTLESMRSCLLEECWEVLDTVERQDLPHMREELGDLLLNVLLFSDIANSKQSATELPQFDSSHFLSGVLEDLCDKLQRRHPHVFGDATSESAEDALGHWQKAKEAERPKDTSLLDSVSRGQAALLYALKLQKKAAKVGFDWPAGTAGQEVRSKIIEELDEFDQALQDVQEAASNTQLAKLEEELGDLLFSVVNLARIHSLNPELALGRSSQKFRQRFQFIEQQLANRQCSVEESSLAELESLWQEAKRQ